MQNHIVTCHIERILISNITDAAKRHSIAVYSSIKSLSLSLSQLPANILRDKKVLPLIVINGWYIANAIAINGIPQGGFWQCMKY